MHKALLFINDKENLERIYILLLLVQFKEIDKLVYIVMVFDSGLKLIHGRLNGFTLQIKELHYKRIVEQEFLNL
jgi:hypothetical protein